LAAQITRDTQAIASASTDDYGGWTGHGTCVHHLRVMYGYYEKFMKSLPRQVFLAPATLSAFCSASQSAPLRLKEKVKAFTRALKLASVQLHGFIETREDFSGEKDL
jgi:hypothetical protein